MKLKIFKMQPFLRRDITISSILSLLFTFLYSYGDYVVFGETINSKLLLKYVIIFVFYNFAICGLYFIIRKEIEIDLVTRIMSKLCKKNSQLYVFCFFLIAWLPGLIIKYPIANHYDSYYQLRSGLGLDPLTTHWPIFYTFILTAFYKAGALLGVHNFGGFCFAAIKCILHAYIINYTVMKLKKTKHQIYWLFLLLSFMLFLQLFQVS